MYSAARPLLSVQLSPSRWLSNGIISARPGLVHHEARAYSMSGTDRADPGESALPKTRCLVATSGFVRGERICTVSTEHVLTGERAVDVLRRLAHTSAGAPHPLPPLEAMVSAIQTCPGSVPLLVTRDSLLVTLALYALRTCPPPATDDALRRLWEWVACMPPRMPPLGTLAVQHFEGTRSFQGLQKRVRVGELSQPVAPGENASLAASDLMVRAVEEGGLEALREPQLEVVLSEEMRVNLYEGRRSPLTPRQFEEAAARTLRGSASTTAQHLLSLEKQLDQTVLRPLTQQLRHAPAAGASSSEEEWRSMPEAEALRWSHFMMRSRGVNLRGGRDTTDTMQLAVVPFLDMLNHAHTPPNVAFHLDAAEAQVVVTAQRRIAPGEELTVHYGSVPQRQCLFGALPASEPHTGPRQAAQRQVRRQEKRQRYELLDEDEAEPAASATSMVPAASSGLPSDSDTRARAEQEAAREADWLWRFGFFRSKQEKAFEASSRWSSGLRRRIADLTDVRRKGRPGEFVIGVPEGLEHLREQRERLERERYQSTKVFPPQRT